MGPSMVSQTTIYKNRWADGSQSTSHCQIQNHVPPVEVGEVNETVFQDGVTVLTNEIKHQLATTRIPPYIGMYPGSATVINPRWGFARASRTSITNLCHLALQRLHDPSRYFSPCRLAICSSMSEGFRLPSPPARVLAPQGLQPWIWHPESTVSFTSSDVVIKKKLSGFRVDCTA